MKYCLLFLIVLTSCFSSAQNLVPNGDFEDTLFCPMNLSGTYGEKIYALTHWFPAGNSPDYLNSCTIYNWQSAQADVPMNGFGFQYAHSGNGYVGLYPIITSPIFTTYREYIGVALSQPMITGTKYYFQMFVSSGYGGPQHIYHYSNNLGVKFSNQFYEAQSNPLLIDNTSHLNNSQLFFDTTNWVSFIYEFVADSNYQYMYLGNFYDNSNTDTVRVGTQVSEGSYVYIDDIILTTDSMLIVGVNHVGLPELRPSKISGKTKNPLILNEEHEEITFYRNSNCCHYQSA